MMYQRSKTAFYLTAVFLLQMFLLLPTAQAENSAVQFGVVTPLTGTNAQNGQDILNGIQLAVERVNKGYDVPLKGGKSLHVGPGLLGKDLQLIVEDNESRPQSAMSAVRKLINTDHVPVILGTYSSGVSLPTGNYANQAKTVEIAAGSSSPKMADIGRYFFDVFGLDYMVGTPVAKFAIEDSGSKRVATMVPNNPFGVGVEINACKGVNDLGGKCVTNVRYKMGESNYRSDIESLLRKKPGAIIFTGYGSEVGLILKQLYQLHPDTRAKMYDVYPTMFASVSAVKNNPKIAKGVKGILVKVTGSFYKQQFLQPFVSKYGHKPNSVYAAFGYDSAMLTALAIKKAKSTNPTQIRDALHAVSKEYKGVSGDKTFNKDGVMASQSYRRLIFKNGELVPYQGK